MRKFDCSAVNMGHQLKELIMLTVLLNVEYYGFLNNIVPQHIKCSVPKHDFYDSKIICYIRPHVYFALSNGVLSLCILLEQSMVNILI
jgi:hypothetical protein